MKRFYGYLDNGTRCEIDSEFVEIGDEYHTIHELYQHRMALTAAFLNYMYMVDTSIRGTQASIDKPIVIKSKLHNDGTMFEGGYFIVMAVVPQGQISYHYDLKHWDLFHIPILERAPKYDGHTSQDVIDRLLDL